ncbi:hypothetical protein QJQ45_012794, partial [Haematococcus lacustris]
KKGRTGPKPVPEDPDNDTLDRDEALQPDLANAQRKRKAAGEARAARDRDNTYHGRRCKLAHLTDHLPQELWDAFLVAVLARVEACSERAVIGSLLLGFLVRDLVTLHVADPLDLHGQPVYTAIHVVKRQCTYVRRMVCGMEVSWLLEEGGGVVTEAKQAEVALQRGLLGLGEGEQVTDNWLEDAPCGAQFFHITERGSTVATEVKAGIVTFLTMSYILLVRGLTAHEQPYAEPLPSLAPCTGLELKSVVACTAATSCLASFLVGVTANLPVGLAPGMGLNAYLVFSQVLGAGTSIEVALATCMVAAGIVAVLALLRALSLILALVPKQHQAGCGGRHGPAAQFHRTAAHVVVRDEETLVGLGNLGSMEVLLAGLGLTLITTLHYHNVNGAILIGVLLTALGASVPTEFVSLPTFMTHQLDFGPLRAGAPDAWSAVTAYVLVMVYGLSNLAGLVKDGSVPGACGHPTWPLQRATALGALTGTSPLIIAAESAVGIKEGGRTGLVAVVVSACFGLALFLAPILQQAVPSVATAPVLVLVGAMMMGEAGHIDWTRMATAVPAFLCMVIQPFTFSIANGIYAGSALLPYDLLFFYCLATRLAPAGLLFTLILFFTTGDFLIYIRGAMARDQADAVQAVVAPTAAGLHAPLLPGRDAEVGGGLPGTSPLSTASHASHFQRQSLSATTAQATNIVRSVSRRIIHDIAASPAYSSSTHTLLISAPARGGMAASYGTSPGHPGTLLGASLGAHTSATGVDHYRSAGHNVYPPLPGPH